MNGSTRKWLLCIDHWSIIINADPTVNALDLPIHLVISSFRTGVLLVYIVVYHYFNQFQPFVKIQLQFPMFNPSNVRELYLKVQILFFKV